MASSHHLSLTIKLGAGLDVLRQTGQLPAGGPSPKSEQGRTAGQPELSGP